TMRPTDLPSRAIPRPTPSMPRSIRSGCLRAGARRVERPRVVPREVDVRRPRDDRRGDAAPDIAAVLLPPPAVVRPAMRPTLSGGDARSGDRHAARAHPGDRRG